MLGRGRPRGGAAAIGNIRPTTTTTTTTTTVNSRRGVRSGTGGDPLTAETPTAIQTNASHGFLQQGGPVPPVATQEQIAVKNVNINATTGMLLNMRNMTEEEIGQTYRDVRIEEQVKQFCKTKLFHWLKFIASRSELGKLTEPLDIGNVVMDGLNIKDETQRPRWWLLYQDVVKKALDTQRSNCNMSIKSVMVGKKELILFQFQVLVY